MSDYKDTILSEIATSTATNVIENIDKFLLKEQSRQDVTEMYDKWSATYERDLTVSNQGYNNPQQVVSELFNCIVNKEDKNIRILDICAGTGLVGLELMKCGYSNIDALDGSQGMLQRAKEKGIYKNYFCEIVTDEKLQHVKDESYDAVLTTGSFVPNHLSPNCLSTLARTVKPGGLIAIAMREEFVRTHPVFQSMEPTIRALENEAVWKVLTWKQVENYWDICTGMVYVMQKI